MYHLRFHSGIKILLEKLASNIKNYLHEKFLLSLEPQKVYICMLFTGWEVRAGKIFCRGLKFIDFYFYFYYINQS